MFPIDSDDPMYNRILTNKQKFKEGWGKKRCQQSCSKSNSIWCLVLDNALTNLKQIWTEKQHTYLECSQNTFANYRMLNNEWCEWLGSTSVKVICSYVLCVMLWVCGIKKRCETKKKKKKRKTKRECSFIHNLACDAFKNGTAFEIRIDMCVFHYHHSSYGAQMARQVI